MAWAKQDPTRTDVSVPKDVQGDWSEYQSAFGRYGTEIYALYRPNESTAATNDLLCAFLDLMFEERGILPVKAQQPSATEIHRQWFQHLLPTLQEDDVIQLLSQRRFVRY